MNKKKGFFVILSVFGYLFLPLFVSFFTQTHPLRALIVFYLVNACVAFFTFRRFSAKAEVVALQAESLEEKVNIQTDSNVKEGSFQRSLKERISRYTALRKIVEELNATLAMDDIAQHLVDIAFSLVASNQGTCIVYLVDQATSTLSLFKTKKQNTSLVIKAKQGDIFDYWVLRHASPLVIEDISKDFRFDREKLKIEDLRPVSSLISSPLLSGKTFIGIIRLDHPQSGYYSQEDLRFLMTVSDLGAVALESGMLYQHTEELAIHDGLTGLFTKGHFLELVAAECKSSLRHERPFSLLMLDIDFFKRYNDTFGHVAGDIVLKTLSSCVVDIVKDELASVSRFGGEEFCVILPGKDKSAARAIAQRIRAGIEETSISLRRQATNVTVSIGAATFPKDAADEMELIMKADKAMYEAKASGRNRVVSV